MKWATWLGRLADRAGRAEASAQLARQLGADRMSILVPWQGGWVPGPGFTELEGFRLESEGAALVLAGGQPLPAEAEELRALLPLFGALLRQELLAQTDLLSNLSHALRTPMSALMGFVYILQQQTEDPDLLEGLAVIQRNGAQVLEVVNDTLELAKIEAGRLPLEQQPVSPAELLEEMRSAWEGPARAKGLDFDVELSGPVPELITTDPSRARQILNRLCANAVKYTERGWVRVRLEQGPRFLVEDSGCGLDAAALETLFIPFYQGRTRLSMPLSRRLARHLGGDLRVESVAGQGTRAFFDLPTSSNVSGLPRDIPSVPCCNGKSPQRVLVVEDNPLAARAVATLLGGMGCEALEALTGEVALEAASQKEFEAVLVDLGLPDMDGWALLKSLRATSQARIIALTGLAPDEVVSPEAGLAFDGVLEKPATREALARALHIST